MYHNYRLNGPRKGEYVYRTRNPNKAVNYCYDELCKQLELEDDYNSANKFSIIDLTDKTVIYFKQSGGKIKKTGEKKIIKPKTDEQPVGQINFNIPNYLRGTVSYPFTPPPNKSTNKNLAEMEPKGQPKIDHKYIKPSAPHMQKHHLNTQQSVHPNVHPSKHLNIYPKIHQSIQQSVHSSIDQLDYRKEIKELRHEIKTLKKKLYDKEKPKIIESEPFKYASNKTNSISGFEALHDLDNIKLGKKKPEKNELCSIM
jgi:hypothetical protein